MPSNSYRTCCRVAVLFGLLLSTSAWGPTSAWCQQPDAEPAPAPPDAVPPAKNKTSLREQTVYIPYSKLRETFEREGRGVFLPYEKFQELWKAARDRQPPSLEQKLPLRSLITEIENEADVSGGVVHVKAKIKIEVLAKGWNEVPLRLADAAVTSATIGGERARLVSDGAGGYKLLVHNPDDDSAQVELLLEYAKTYTKAPGQNSVSFQSPLAPVNRWQIRIPEPGVKVDVHPLLAATEVPAKVAMRNQVPKPPVVPKPNGGGDGEAQDVDADEEEEEQDVPKVKPKAKSNDEAAEETMILAFVGATPSVRIDWTPKAEGATGLDALASVQSRQEVSIDQGVMRSKTQLSYEISRAALSKLTLEAPLGHKVAGVFDSNVRRWQVEEVDQVQVITVELFQPARVSQNLVVELERFYDEADPQQRQIPAAKAVGVGRQQGVVVVRLADGLRAEATRRAGLLQLDTADMPKSLAARKWDFAYRYATLPFDLALDVEKVHPRLQVDELVEAYLLPERLTLDLLAIYDIQRAGVFELELDVPDGFEVVHVRGQQAAGAAAVAVDSYHLADEPAGRLRVNLRSKALGRAALFVELQKRLSDANLLSPTGESSELTLPLPHVTSEGLERQTGRLVVYAPDSLRLTAASQDGLRSVGLSEALAGTASMRSNRFPSVRSVLSYAYNDPPEPLAVSAQRRKPQVTAAQLLVARVDAGVVKYEAKIRYEILYSGVDSLRVDVPEALAATIHNRSRSLRESTIDPAPEDLDEGYVAWKFTGESELLGHAEIDLAWEERLEELKVGASVEIKIPRLIPRDVERASGHIVLGKAETIDVIPAGTPEGLQPIDPEHDLPAGQSVPDAAMAFRFQDDWSLALKATRYQLEMVKGTSVERAVLRMVATRSDQLAVQALYRMRSAAQRLEVRLPDDVKEGHIEFDTQPVRINGRPVPLERGKDDKTFYVPLVGHGTEEPFVLELRYTAPGSASRFDYPEFPGEPAVQKVYLCAYLPDELSLLGTRGPWTDEMDWHASSPVRWTPIPKRSDNELISWLSDGCQVTGNALSTFQTDGRLHLFSTLRPDPAPEGGALRLVTMDETWLGIAVFGIVLGAGVVLLPRSASERLIVVAGSLVALVLVGVFLTTFSRQILGGELYLAIFLVLLIWFAKFAVRDFPRMVRNIPWPRAGRPVDSSAEPPPVATSAATQEPAVQATAVADQPPPDTTGETGTGGESPTDEVADADESSSDEQQKEGDNA